MRFYCENTSSLNDLKFIRPRRLARRKRRRKRNSGRNRRVNSKLTSLGARRPGNPKRNRSRQGGRRTLATTNRGNNPTQFTSKLRRRITHRSRKLRGRNGTLMTRNKRNRNNSFKVVARGTSRNLNVRPTNNRGSERRTRTYHRNRRTNLLRPTMFLNAVIRTYRQLGALANTSNRQSGRRRSTKGSTRANRNDITVTPNNSIRRRSTGTIRTLATGTKRANRRSNTRLH